MTIKYLEGRLLNVTQMAAIEAARAAGQGDNTLADWAAVNSMRNSIFIQVPMMQEK